MEHEKSHVYRSSRFSLLFSFRPSPSSFSFSQLAMHNAGRLCPVLFAEGQVKCSGCSMRHSHRNASTFGPNACRQHGNEQRARFLIHGMHPHARLSSGATDR